MSIPPDGYVEREPSGERYIAVCAVWDGGSFAWRYYPATSLGEQNARDYARVLEAQVQDDRDMPHVCMMEYLGDLKWKRLSF